MERSDVNINWFLSPRLIMVEAPSDEMTAQDLVDTLREAEDDAENIDDLSIISAAGKEDLGGGVKVGITTTLQNAQLAFEPRTTVTSSGTATSSDSSGSNLVDSMATFSGVEPGATIINFSDYSIGTVLSVDSETSIRHMTLDGGFDNEWDIGDAYRIYNIIQCEAIGGNIVAVDSNGDSMSAIFPTAFTQIVRTSSSSATLQELESIQFSSFNGGVTIDVVNGTAGTLFPIGTLQMPVSNVTDAKTIALERGFFTFYIIGDITLGSESDIDSFILIGQNPNKSSIVILDVANVNECEFKEATISGTLDGNCIIEDCTISYLFYVEGLVKNSILAGNVTLGGTETSHFLGCWSGVVGTQTPTINMGGSGRGLGMRSYSGGIKIVNKNGSENISIDLISGQVKLDSSVVSGTIVIRGTGTIEDYSSAEVDLNALLNTETMTRTSWDTVYINTIIGTSGTDFPLGTLGYPVNNISNAKTISEYIGSHQIHLHGNITLDSSFAGYTFGSEVSTGTIINLNNQDIDHAFFENITLSGSQNGHIHTNGCLLVNITNMEGEFKNSIISSDLDCKTGGWTYIWGGRAVAATLFYVDMNGAAKVTMGATINCMLKNMTSSEATFLKEGSGATSADDTNTAGNIMITGDGNWTDLGVGAGVNVIDDTIRNTVWTYDTRTLTSISGVEVEGDWTLTEKKQIRYALGVDGSQTAPSQPGYLAQIIQQILPYNISLEEVRATSQNSTRKVAVGEVDRINFRVKNEGDADWTSPTSSGTLYAWYTDLEDVSPQFMKESN